MWEEGWCCTAGGRQGILVLVERTGEQKLSSLLPPPGQHGDIEARALTFTGELFLTISEKNAAQYIINQGFLYTGRLLPSKVGCDVKEQC